MRVELYNSSGESEVVHGLAPSGCSHQRTTGTPGLILTHSGSGLYSANQKLACCRRFKSWKVRM